jgi:hypothetical protein
MNADKLKQKPEQQMNTDKTHQRSDLAQLSYLCPSVVPTRMKNKTA